MLYELSNVVLVNYRSKKRKRKHAETESGSNVNDQVDTDALEHGGWWCASSTGQLAGALALEFGKHTYVRALDNGLFTLGAPHEPGEPPAPEEILTAVPIGERTVALKSGYGKYLSVERGGAVTGRSDAIGAHEHWEAVFEAGKAALQAHNGCFMSVDTEDDALIAVDRRAQDQHVVQLRLASGARDPSMTGEARATSPTTQDRGNLSQVEVSYVKKFQKFQDKRLRVCDEDVGELRRARQKGNFHEALLDRRSKMKADRYCK